MWESCGWLIQVTWLEKTQKEGLQGTKDVSEYVSAWARLLSAFSPERNQLDGWKPDGCLN